MNATQPQSDQNRRASDGETGNTHWTFKKEIQLGHVFTTLTVAFSCFIYVSKIEARLSLVEQQTSTMASVQHERDDRQDKTNTDMMSLLRSQLERMEMKIDRIVEHK